MTVIFNTVIGISYQGFQFRLGGLTILIVTIARAASSVRGNNVTRVVVHGYSNTFLTMEERACSLTQRRLIFSRTGNRTRRTGSVYARRRDR